MTEFNLVNVRGRVTYSNFTMAQAIAANERPTTKFKKPADKVAPDFQLLLTQSQLEKVATHLTDVFIPEAVARANEKANKLSAKAAKSAVAAIEEIVNGNGLSKDDWPALPFLPFKPVYEKTAELVPDAVATMRFTGNNGRDIIKRARALDEGALRVPDTTPRVYPLLLPIEETVYDLYPGSLAFTTGRLFAFEVSGTNYGISAYADTIVFLRDDERLGGGGGGIDTEGVFMDDDED